MITFMIEINWGTSESRRTVSKADGPDSDVGGLNDGDEHKEAGRIPSMMILVRAVYQTVARLSCAVADGFTPRRIVTAGVMVRDRTVTVVNNPKRGRFIIS